MLSFDFLTLVSNGEVGPHVFEQSKVVLEVLKHVIGLQIVLFKLLDCDQDKEIEHDKSLDGFKGKEEQLIVSTTTSVPCHTVVILSVATVSHDVVPVFPC
jgi:hypothetical protein